MQYRVVFDLLRSGYKDWWFPAFGLIFVAIGLGAVVFRLRPGPPFQPTLREAIFPYWFLAFAVLWVAVSFASTYSEYASLRRALETGRAEVVEGVVADFTPMPYSGHTMECFTVGGHTFSYSDYVVTAGFNTTSSHGGPIRAGLPVRVTFVDATIVRLEIKD